MQNRKPISPPKWHILDPFYADERPWPLIPVYRRSKKAFSAEELKKQFGDDVPDKALDYHLSEQAAKDLFRRRFNLGLACGNGVGVLDFDPRNFRKKDKADKAAKLSYIGKTSAALGIDIKSSPIVWTGGNGVHVYFRYDPERKISGKLKTYPGLDIKTSGYVIAPGSVHPDGPKYRWAGDKEYVDLAEAPTVSERFYKLAERKRVRANSSTALSGTRNPGQQSVQVLESLLEFIDPKSLSYDDWFGVQAAAKYEFGAASYQVLDAWNVLDPDRYDSEANRACFESLDNERDPKLSGYKFGTLIHFAKSQGGGEFEIFFNEYLRPIEVFAAWNAELENDEGLANEYAAIAERGLAKTIEKKPQQANDWLSEMNEAFAHVLIGGKAKIMRFNANGGLRDYIDIAALKSEYRNQTVFVGEDRKTKANAWLDHPSRRSYAGVDFVPNGDTPSEIFNLFSGFATKPDPSASCSRFLDHLKFVICEGDEEGYEYLIRWMAHLVQKPEEKPGVAIVLRGKKGIGKDTVATYLSRVIGKPYAPIVGQSEQLTGRFLSHLERALLVCVEEGSWAGNRKDEGVLKSLITAPDMLIERKGVEAYQVQSYKRFIITSNANWAVPASADERRFAVYDIRGDRKDSSYYDALYAELDNGGAEALHYHLRSLDLSQFVVRVAPKTRGLVNQKITSLRDLELFWFECLSSGEIPGSHPRDVFDEETQDWARDRVLLTKESFRSAYDAYLAKAKKEGSYQSSPIGAPQFTQTLRDLCPGVRITRRVNGQAGKVPCFDVPSLETCRKSMEQWLGSKLDWGEY